MAHSQFPRIPQRLYLMMAISLSTAAHAEPAQIIFAAENALYGAGYRIGQADGWLDDTLRTAIRQYQSETRGLQSTGNLDSDTLAALGVTTRPEGTITANTLPNRNATMAALGLKAERFSAAKDSERLAAAVSRPEPEPRPETVIADSPESEPVAPATESSEADVASESVNTAQASQPSPETAPAPDATQSSSQSSPDSPAVATSAPSRDEPTSEPAPPQTASTQAASATSHEEPAENQSVIEANLPDEPTAAGNPVARNPEAESAVETPKPATQKSSGGFLNALFDFLFGWLV